MTHYRVSVATEDASARELLAINVIRLRRKHGWTQVDLAEFSGFNRSFIAQVETRSRNVSIDNIERLATTLGAPMRDLFKPERVPVGHGPSDKS